MSESTYERPDALPMTASEARAPDDRRIARSYPAVELAVGQARRELETWLRSGAADDLMTGDIAVAVSEACTNAVVHAYRDQPIHGSGASLFELTAEHVGETVTVTIADAGCGMHPRPDSPGLGLGLPLIAMLTDHLEMRTGPDGAGTAVVMVFTTPGAHGRTVERPRSLL